MRQLLGHLLLLVFVGLVIIIKRKLSINSEVQWRRLDCDKQEVDSL